MKKFLNDLFPAAIIVAYIVAMMVNIFVGTKGDMVEFILGMILLMIYAKG